MIRLVKLAWVKVRSYSTFWVLAGIHFVLMAFILLNMQGWVDTISAEANFNFNGDEVSGKDLLRIDLYQYPEIWNNVTYIAGFFKYFLAFLVIILVANDYNFRMLRQSIMTGLSRAEYIFLHLISILGFTLLSTAIVFIIILFLGRQPENFSEPVFSRVNFLFGYFTEVFAFLSFSFFLATLLKRSGLTIVLLLAYAWFLEPIGGFLLRDSVGGFLPVQAITNIIPNPLEKFINYTDQSEILWPRVLASYGYCALFFLATYWRLKGKDL